MIRFVYPDKADLVLKRLKKAGIKAYIVGGAVRDTLRQRLAGDVDILARADLNQVKSLFLDQKVKIVGKTFPICLVNNIEIAVPRQFSQSCQSSPADWLISDLACRDFTINAMAWDPDTGTLADPFNGQTDLENAILRFTRNPEQRIKEDPVRMIRACRFAALVKGQIEPDSLGAIHSFKDLLDSDAAVERIQAEILKAMRLDQPSLFFKALAETGLLERIFPSLDRCQELDGGPHHGESVFEHCLMVGDALSANQPLLRLAGFLHDTGKFDAQKIKAGKLTFPGHENHVDALERDLEKLRFSKADTAYMIAVTRAHMRPLDESTTPKAARRLLAMLSDHDLTIQDFLRHRIADRKGNWIKEPYTLAEIRIKLEKLLKEIHSDSVLDINCLAISGNEIVRLLDIPPGPVVGQVKQTLFEKVLDDPSLNTKESLITLCQSLNLKIIISGNIK